MFVIYLMLMPWNKIQAFSVTLYFLTMDGIIV